MRSLERSVTVGSLLHRSTKITTSWPGHCRNRRGAAHIHCNEVAIGRSYPEPEGAERRELRGWPLGLRSRGRRPARASRTKRSTASGLLSPSGKRNFSATFSSSWRYGPRRRYPCPLAENALDAVLPSNDVARVDAHRGGGHRHGEPPVRLTPAVRATRPKNPCSFAIPSPRPAPPPCKQRTR
jgi:hypothetical protein